MIKATQQSTMCTAVKVYKQGKSMRPYVPTSKHIAIGDRITIGTLSPMVYKVTGINHVCGVIKSIEVD